MIAQSLSIALSCLTPAAPLQDAPPGGVRLVDVNGDGALDRLLFDADGGMRIALHVSGRDYAEVAQVLPRVSVPRDLLACDLDGDGHTDLLLVTPGRNVALLGDGTGHFVEATERLGLLDRGDGLGVERCDLDADGRSDLLLHNRWGDVVFYGTGAGFERDPGTPEGPRLSGALPAPGGPPADARPPAPEDPGARGSKGSQRVPVGVAGSPVGVQTAGGAPASAGPGPIVGDAQELSTGGLFGGMATSLRDVTSGQGVRADTTPTLGRLLPLGPELFVGGDGDVGLGTLAPGAALHVEGGSPTGIGLKVGDGLTVRSDFPFTGVGRATQVTGVEAFGVQSPVTSGYGGMYVNTEGITGQPFYGYATGGTARAWSYFHVPSAEWRLWNGTNRLTIGSDGEFRVQNDGLVVTANGDVGIRTTTPAARLHVQGDFIAGTVAIGVQDLSGSIAGSGRLRVNGNVTQDSFRDGLVKAGVYVRSNPMTVLRSFNNLPGGSPITVAYDSLTGVYTLDFGIDVSNRFAQVTARTSFDVFATVQLMNNVALVRLFKASGSSGFTDFHLILY